MTDPELTHQWVSDLDADTVHTIITLVNSATGDGGTLGYAEPMSAGDADAFVDGLRRRVAAGESHVLSQ